MIWSILMVVQPDGVIKMNKTEENTANDYLFDLATSLIMYVQESLAPSNKYYTLRMLDVIIKLADFPQHSSEMNEDPFLQHVKQEIENAEGLFMNDQNAFLDFISNLVDKFVDEMKNRR